MRIAILGSTSQIAKDLVRSFAAQGSHELVLYSRRPEVVSRWLSSIGSAVHYEVVDFAEFDADERFDAVINFVGVGDPAQAAVLGTTIFDFTKKYDDLALDYVRRYPGCRYIFLSSGAAYGASFDAPVDENTKAVIAINHLQQQDWYGVAKLYAECRHRALAPLPIVDLRIFNYFSHTQDLEARFLITDILRAIRDETVLKTSAENIFRDFLHPSDFYQLVTAILTSPATNTALDCFTKAPIDKISLLGILKIKFGLKYEIVQSKVGLNTTGTKPHYYSLNKRAEDYGYRPMLNSLDGILNETNIIVNQLGNENKSSFAWEPINYVENSPRNLDR